MNQKVKKTLPQIHLIIHLSKENDTPFIESPFQILVTNIRVISIKDIPPGEYTVSVGFKDNLMKETRKTNDLIWQEEFSLAMPLDEPVLKINLNKDKKAIAKTTVFIGFEVEEIVKNWYPLKPNGNINLAIQVAPNYVKPFLNEKFEDFPPATELTAFFRIIEGNSLTAMDSNGKNDAYCTVTNLTKPKIIKSTQILYKSVNPKWNYFVNIKIYDYEKDVIRISCYDYDKLSKDDLIGYKDLFVKDMGQGNLKDEWISIFNSDSGSKGKLHIMYQICTVDWIPYKTILYQPLRRIHIHVMDGYEIPNTDLIGKTDPYVKLKLNDQEFAHQTLVMNNTLNPLWDQTITLFSLCQKPSLQIELRDEATGKDPLLGTKSIDLSDIPNEKIVEFTEELIPAKGMKKGGIIHFYIQITNSRPFVNAKFTRHIDTGKKTKRGNG
jgi:Ca2+-dependent lipid-binding protein